MSQPGNSFTCNHCNESFCTLKLYADHSVIHCHINNVQFSCPIAGCFRKYHNISSFKAHVSRNHNNKTMVQFQKPENLQCNISSCKQQLSDLQSLIRHLQNHI